MVDGAEGFRMSVEFCEEVEPDDLAFLWPDVDGVVFELRHLDWSVFARGAIGQVAAEVGDDGIGAGGGAAGLGAC
jgi:hypothetical protein